MRTLSVVMLTVMAVLAAMVPLASARLFYVVLDPYSKEYFVVEEVDVSSKLQGRQNDVRAIVNYSHTIMETGWDTLNVTTAADMPDEEQAYAAGYGEGVATYEATWNNYLNQAQPGQPPMPSNISTWVQQNWAWMSTMSATKNTTSPYWKQVGLLQLQFQGLLDGLNAAAPNSSMQFTFDMLQSINLAGDLMDLYAALNISQMSSTWRDMNKADFQSWFARSTHCSALVKLKYDYSEIYFGHATWSTFNMMVRVFKHYHLNFHNVTAQTISLSGYAGVLASIDDYYVASNGLAITETSFTILNNSLYANCHPQQLFYWVRALVATRLAASAKEWCDLFAEYNSGTYNNQWIVLDTNKFTPFQDLVPGTLYIAEQIPGQVGIKDVTATLQYGYWPSYNIPSIEELYVVSGNQEAALTQGWEMNDYERCVRAQIFRRDQTNVVDIPSMQFMMQYNDYVYDPISQGNPTYAVASRGDLTPEQPMCWGAIDAKITSVSLMRSGLQTWAFSGPTPQQPVFDALTTNATIMCSPFNGQPAVWNFSFLLMQPS